MITPRLRLRALIALGAVLAVTATLAATGDAASADTAPSNNTPPAVSGTAEQGKTLTTNSGSWSGTTPMTFTYAWDRCDSSGGSCNSISGETSNTYTIKSADVGHTLRSSVTATNGAGSADQLSAATSVVAATSAPSNTGEPKISGSATVGSQLTVSNGSWSGSTPITYDYKWQRCDTNGNNCNGIDNANDQKYTVVSADTGHTLRAKVTATNSAGNTTATADATSVVGTNSPALVTEPKISGTPTDGQTLTVSSGTWSGATPFTFTYQWQRCDANGNNCNGIGGATAASYKLTSSDVGKTIRAQVTAKNSSGSANRTTNAVGPVKAVTGAAGCVIAAASVASSDRLTVSSVKFSPSISHKRAPVVATFKVTDANKCAVSGALVYVVGLPYNRMAKALEAPTNSTGQISITIIPTRYAPLRGALVMFVRARTPQGNLLAGSSTRRLIQLLLRP
ncbi:MAG TPA: hypothetical protein VFW85_11765 [Gaiellaceae bacterium]|nr:hypothetical protein [Gaiellaceae bacterium]